jgi:hypothetical protein
VKSGLGALAIMACCAAQHAGMLESLATFCWWQMINGPNIRWLPNEPVIGSTTGNLFFV